MSRNLVLKGKDLPVLSPAKQALRSTIRIECPVYFKYGKNVEVAPEATNKAQGQGQLLQTLAIVKTNEERVIGMHSEPRTKAQNLKYITKCML